jgi:hypothetical protein
MITRVSSVIRPKGSDLIFDHPYNAEYLPVATTVGPIGDGTQIARFWAWLKLGCGRRAVSSHF